MACSSCPGGPIEARIFTIRKMSETLAQGHHMLAGMYEDISQETKVPGDDVLFRAAAAAQRFLAQESLKVTVPASISEEQFNEAGKEDNRDGQSGPDGGDSNG